MWASELIRRNQAKALYAARLYQQQGYNSGRAINVGAAATMIPNYATEVALGTQALPLAEQQAIAAAVEPPAPPPPTSAGSFYMDGTDDGVLSVAYSAAMTIGSQNFTIEWWQKMENNSENGRVFAVGDNSTGNESPGVSIEDEAKRLLFWYNGIWYDGEITFPSVFNTWTHFALVGNDSSFTFYINGESLAIQTLIGPYNFTNNDELPFILGGTPEGPGDSHYQGYISNFRFVLGSRVYTTNFTPPTTNLEAISGTVLLLGSDPANPFVDASSSPKSVTRFNGVSWTSDAPF